MNGRDAPEWFGGGEKPSLGTSSGKASSSTTASHRSSSGTQRRHSASRRLSGSGSGNSSGTINANGKENERRKRPSHMRKKSREVIHVKDVFDSKQLQDTNFVARVAPIENKVANKIRPAVRNEPKSRSSKSTNADAKDLRDRSQRKPSLLEKLLGLSPTKASTKRNDTEQDNASQRKPLISKDDMVHEIVRSKSTGSVDSDPTNCRKSRDASSSDYHRRSYSDSIDLSQIYFSTHIPSSSAASFPDPPGTTKQEPSSNYSHAATMPLDQNNGMESDDPLVYSEDESTSAFVRQVRSAQQKFPYQSAAFNQNQESQQVLEQHRMMAIAPNRQVVSYAKPSPPLRSAYGSINVPPNFQRPSSTSPVNEFYVSEDETLMSDTSWSRKSWQRSVRDYQMDAEKVIPEEDEGASESTSLLSPKSSNPVLNSALSVRSSNSSHSNGANNKGVPTGTTPSLSNTSVNSSSGSFDVDSLKIRRRESTPPPLQTVAIKYPDHHRTVSASTATTVSTSLHSPQKGILRQNLQTGPARTFSRKEQKRILRKLEALEKKEYKIQSIIRSGHNNALDWSGHVPQQIQGLNLAAGFFPREETKTHDFPFAILFLAQMCFIIFIAITYIGDTVSHSPGTNNVTMHSSESDPFSGSPFLSHQDSEMGTFHNSKWNIYVEYSNALQLSCISALYSASLSALLIGMMMILGKALIPTTLCLAILICIAFSTIGIALSPYSFVPIIGIIALAFSVGYSIVVWDRIPFAATNLDTALCGVKCTADVLVVGLIMMIAAFLWTITWTVAFLGVYNHYLDDVRGKGGNDFLEWTGVLIYGGMFTSYFWTLTVIMNVIHVTVAGVVAQWWSDPGSMNTCCNNVLRENFVLSLTSSFGSICLGSFMSPLLRVLKGTFSMCCNTYSSHPNPLAPSSSHESMVSKTFGDHSVRSDPPNFAQLPVTTSPFDGAIKYYNDYGFTFLGIYREKFSESSRKATEVFETREWVGIVSDQLIDNVLALIITAITLGTGCLGLVVEEFDGYSLTSFHKPAFTAFTIGCYIGLVVSSVCLKVVASSVNTVFVCFALAPWTFQANHPGLSKEMRESWGGLWLDEYEWLNAAELGVEREDMTR